MILQHEFIDNLDCVTWIGSILIASFDPLNPYLGTEYNIALLTNKTIYSIFKIVFCVIIHIALITKN